MIPYGRRLTLALVVALVVIVLSGSGLAYLIGRGHLARADQTAAGAANPAVTVSAPPHTTAGSSAAGSSGPAASSEGRDASGPVTVELSPSAENAPHARDVADLIARFFGSINRHDYDSWLTTVTTSQARRDRDSWTVDYSTTRDSDIYVSDITPGKPMTVRMQFTSHQGLRFAPEQLRAECVRWDVTYQILDEGVGLRVGNSAKAPAVAPC